MLGLRWGFDVAGAYAVGRFDDQFATMDLLRVPRFGNLEHVGSLSRQPVPDGHNERA